MATRSRKRRKERKRVSAYDASRKQRSGFTPTAFRLPENMKLFSVKKACSKRISLVEYEVGKGNEEAAEGMYHYWLIYYAHTGVGPDNETYVCPAKMRKQRCPICEYRNKLIDEGNSNEKLMNALKQKKRVILQVFDHGEEEEGLKLWEGSYWFGFGEKLNNKLKLLEEQGEEKYEFFSREDEEGFYIEIDFAEKTWEGRKNWPVDSLSFRERKKALPDEIVDAAVCLEDLLIIEPYDKLKAIFFQTGEVEESESKEVEDEDENAEEPKNQVLGECPACEGSGKNSKGRKCLPCKGTGVLEDDDDDIIEEQVEEKEEKKETVSASVSGDADEDDDWDF